MKVSGVRNALGLRPTSPPPWHGGGGSERLNKVVPRGNGVNLGIGGLGASRVRGETHASPG